jgi:soluble lytic murein transglycosylase
MNKALPILKHFKLGFQGLFFSMLLAAPSLALATQAKLSQNETDAEEKVEINVLLEELHRTKPVRSRDPIENRLTQAKELMGQRYKKFFKFAKRIKKPDQHIRDYVKTAFENSKSSEKHARATARAIIFESKKYGFDPFFLLAIVQNESQFDVRARGDAGEIGLMQILPTTAKWICEMNNWKWHGKKTLLDPAQNIKIGAAYLNILREKFESESQLYISAYNMGPSNVYRALNHQVTPKDYHSRVLGYYISYYKQLKKEFDEEGST